MSGMMIPNKFFYQLCPDDHKYIERWQVLPYALLLTASPGRVFLLTANTFFAQIDQLKQAAQRLDWHNMVTNAVACRHLILALTFFQVTDKKRSNGR